jgi:four helix bundle protein
VVSGVIRTYKDLDVYQRAYKASVIVMTKLIMRIPESEKRDLRDQLSRSSKSIPRLLAEGYARRNQARAFQKYLEDALGECNETQVSLNHCADIYGAYVDKSLCAELDKEYDIVGKQIYRLSQAWSRVKVGVKS